MTAQTQVAQPTVDQELEKLSWEPTDSNGEVIPIS